MAKGFKHGAGGSNPLNFKIVAYATEEELLAATPKENTIGIITTTPITSWIFSATEPETPVEGMVWITTGTSSTVEFNALKKHGIQVYPLSAKQYVSGALVDKKAKSYQSGEWVDWWNGDIYINGAFNRITGFAPTNGTVENSGGIFTAKTSGNAFSSFCSNEKLDITGVREIAVTFEEGTQTFVNTGNAGFGISDTAIAPQHASYLAMTKFTNMSFSGVFVVPVAGIDREVYFGFTIGGSTSLPYGTFGLLKISKIEMRR